MNLQAMAEAYEERAAIMQYDAGMAQDRAEKNGWWCAFCRNCQHWDNGCQKNATPPQCGHFQAR